MTSASWYNAVRETITSNIFAKNVWPESNHEDIIKSRTGTFYEATGEEGAFLEYMRPKIYQPNAMNISSLFGFGVLGNWGEP